MICKISIIDKLKFMRIIKYSVFIFLLINSLLFAQNSVKINDTTVSRETVADIPLLGTIQSDNLNTLTIELIYDARIIDLQSASGGIDYAIKESTPDFKTDFSKIDSARVTITSHNASTVTNGIICMLHIRGLVFSDSLAYILPFRLLINNEEVPAIYQKGIIKVPGIPIFPNFPDNLSHGYPNPFSYQTRFDFSLQETSSVKFLVYTMIGIKVVDSDDSQGMLRVFSYDDNSEKTDLSALKKGTYYVLFTPQNQEIASQYFIFVMKTDRGVFNTNIIYCK